MIGEQLGVKEFPPSYQDMKVVSIQLCTPLQGLPDRVSSIYLRVEKGTRCGEDCFCTGYTVLMVGE